MKDGVYASGVVALFCSIILFFGSGLNSIGFFAGILLFIYFICIVVIGIIVKTSEKLDDWTQRINNDH